MHIPPFAADGSLENLIAIRSFFNDKLEIGDVYPLIVALEGWLSNSYVLMNQEITGNLS